MLFYTEKNMNTNNQNKVLQKNYPSITSLYCLFSDNSKTMLF